MAADDPLARPRDLVQRPEQPTVAGGRCQVEGRGDAGGRARSGVHVGVDPAPVWQPGVLLIELKRPKSYDTTAGKLSTSQKTFQAACETAGVPYEIARSIDDCERLLKDRGLI